jgi:hypothetical protein
MTPAGAQRNPLHSYPVRDFRCSSVPLTDVQRDTILGFAREQVAQHTQYGWLDIVALGASLTGHAPHWLWDLCKREDRLVCSQLVAVAYAHAGAPLGDIDPYLVTPGYLAELITKEIP